MRLVSYFFDKNKIIVEVQNLGLGGEEKEKIFNSILELVEYRLLDFVLDRLQDQDKKIFLDYWGDEEEKDFVQFLTDKIENAEVLLGEQSRILENEVIEDLRKTL